MGSKENLSSVSTNIARLLASGAILYGGIYWMELRNQNKETGVPVTSNAYSLTNAEIAQLRSFEQLMTVLSETTPTATPQKPSGDIKMFSVETDTSTQRIIEMTAVQKLRIENYRLELPAVIAKINPSPQETDDLEIYYPIYRAAQDKFSVPWYLIWIVHEEESTASRNPQAFREGAAYVGAMGRFVALHPQTDVDRANIDMKYLMVLPTRNPSDSTEIVWGTAALAQYITEAGNISGGLKRYSAEGPAITRFKKFQQLSLKLGN